MPCQLLMIIDGSIGREPGTPVSLKNIDEAHWTYNEGPPTFGLIEITDKTRQDLTWMMGSYGEWHATTEEEEYFGLRYPKATVQYRYHFDWKKLPAGVQDGLAKGQMVKVAWADVEKALVDDKNDPKFRRDLPKPDNTALIDEEIATAFRNRHPQTAAIGTQREKFLLLKEKDAEKLGNRVH